MTTIEWHSWPENPLPKTEFAELYLVTAKTTSKNARPFVRSVYSSGGFENYPELQIVAWAKMPDPYEQKELHEVGSTDWGRADPEHSQVKNA